MKRKAKVVFDTNIYISAILFGGNPRVCLELARTGEIELFASHSILLELAFTLRESFNWSDSDIRDVIEGMAKFTKVVSPKHKVSKIKEDPDDNRILECAKEAEVDFIISGDKKHLLSLGEFNHCPIISAKRFLEKFYQGDN